MSELSRQSGKADINIEDGVDYKLTAIYKVNGVVVDITGYSASFKLRENAGSSNILLSLTESSGIAITGALGKVFVQIADTQSIYGSRKMVYSLTITDTSGDIIQLLHGECKSWSSGE